MHAILSGLIVLCVGLCQDVRIVAPQELEISGQVVVVSGDDGQMLIRKAEDDPARIFIGVRMSPVPAPLAAHIGDSGLMVANIVIGSPADNAGLERYDVIRSFNGQTTDETNELIEAIQKVGAGRKAQMVVIRGGDEERLSIRPAEREDAEQAEWKYDEPSPFDNVLRLRGHTLNLGDDGKVILEDLGELKRLPDRLKSLKLLKRPDLDFDFDFDSDDFKILFDKGDLKGFGVRDLDILTDLDFDVDMEGEITIKIADEGGKVMIHRAKDGTIEVERVDEDGNETSKTYEDMDDLEENDPEAFELLTRHAHGGQRGVFMRVKPHISLLPGKQKRFQALIEKALDDAGKARDQAQRIRTKILRRQGLDDVDVEYEAATISIKAGGDGKVVVIINRDGKTETHEFDSWDEFKNAKPDLFDKIEIHIEDDDEPK